MPNVAIEIMCSFHSGQSLLDRPRPKSNEENILMLKRSMNVIVVFAG